MTSRHFLLVLPVLVLLGWSLLGATTTRQPEPNVFVIPVPLLVERVAVDEAVAIPAEAWEWLRMEPVTLRVTAYTLRDPGMRPPSHPAFGVTASGAPVMEGITAACGPSYPFGTVFVVETLGPRVCLDRGSAVGDGDLDVYTHDRKAALRFGVQRLDALVIMPLQEVANGRP